MKIPQPKSAQRTGLAMLIGGATTTNEPVVVDAPIPGESGLLALRLDEVYRNASQPRTVFDSEAIHSLATSIETNGVIQPIAVRPRPAGGYEIIAGERRWLAAQRAGLRTIPAVLHDVDEQETLVLALVENLVREDLSPLETARAYAALQDEFKMSVADLARAVGRSRPAVSNTIRLLELPDDALAMLERGQLTEGHGRALLGCSDRVRLLKLARLTLDRSLTVRALEALVREQEQALRDGTSPTAVRRTKWNVEPDTELLDRVERLSEQLLGVRARVKLGTGGGKLELHCDAPADLHLLVDRLEAALATTV
ncbi:MAG: parB-like partition protein [Thermoleophilia bacterium]|nr:parB-like partition protein [Thermoleophilia bacterium]MCZ4496209.1 parB-like partition protein [Thermoleophilia bacterium]